MNDWTEFFRFELVASEGISMPPPNMLFWHTDCLELREIEKEEISEGLSALSPFMPKSRVKISPETGALSVPFLSPERGSRCRD